MTLGLPIKFERLSDRPDLIPLCAALSWTEFSVALQQEGVETVEMLEKDFISDAPSHCVAIDASGTFLGFCGMYIANESYTGIFENGTPLVQVAVAPGARGKGLARAMIDLLEQDRKRLGEKKLHLFADPHNVDLYVKLGFTKGPTVPWGKKLITLFEKEV